MLEIGDNLPSLQNSPDRKRADRESAISSTWCELGKASVPVDLMSYADSDRQPSIFFLKESARQSILTVFNWTEQPRQSSLSPASVSRPAATSPSPVCLMERSCNPRRARFKSISPAAGARAEDCGYSDAGKSAASLDPLCRRRACRRELVVFSFSGGRRTRGAAVVDFGDGVRTEGAQVNHAWTEPGDYQVSVTATGLDDKQAQQTCTVAVKGYLPSVFAPQLNQRYPPKPQ